MPESNNPPFRVPNQTSRKPMREFIVGAPEDDFMDQQNLNDVNQSTYNQPSAQEIEKARELYKEKARASARISDGAKRRIEILANIGRLEKDVEIGGTVFSIRTLKTKEYEDASLAMFQASYTQLEAGFVARKQQLARSLFKIDGQDISLVLGDNSIENKLLLLDELEEIVITKLWEDFLALKEDARRKYGISTAEQVKEVSEDLKKL